MRAAMASLGVDRYSFAPLVTPEEVRLDAGRGAKAGGADTGGARPIGINWDVDPANKKNEYEMALFGSHMVSWSIEANGKVDPRAHLAARPQR